jgi:hypothetical protein
MMAKAFVLVQVHLGKEPEVAVLFSEIQNASRISGLLSELGRMFSCASRSISERASLTAHHEVLP